MLCAQFCCPIAGVAFNGRYKFSVIKATGHVVRGGGGAGGEEGGACGGCTLRG